MREMGGTRAKGEGNLSRVGERHPGGLGNSFLETDG
jgi:hypothetical protein